MRRTTQPSHAITGAFVFLLLGVFAVFCTVMVLLGARAYKGTVDQLSAHNGARIAPAYVRSMVRADDGRDAWFVEDVDGMTAVTLLNRYDDEAYITRIYCHDGQLYEWFTDAERPFDPQLGEPVCPCEALTASLEDGLLTVNLLNDGEWTAVDIALRAER